MLDPRYLVVTCLLVNTSAPVFIDCHPLPTSPESNEINARAHTTTFYLHVLFSQFTPGWKHSLEVLKVCTLLTQCVVVVFFLLNRYDEQSGLYCPNSFTNVTECLGFRESRPVHMSRQTEQYLQRYYSRHNQNLLRMNQKIEFPLPKWIHG